MDPRDVTLTAESPSDQDEMPKGSHFVTMLLNIQSRSVVCGVRLLGRLHSSTFEFFPTCCVPVLCLIGKVPMRLGLGLSVYITVIPVRTDIPNNHGLAI